MAEQVSNTSLFNARQISIGILLVAIGISGYLSYLKWDASTQVVCVPGEAFDCGTVLNSSYSEIQDVPIAWLGLGTNLLLLALLLLEPRIPLLREWGIPISFGILLFATLYSIFLIYVQAVIILKYCPWCLTHEALVFILFGLSLVRLFAWMNRDYHEGDVVLSESNM